MSRMNKRIAAVALLLATFVGASSVVTAAPASALPKPSVDFST